ncbi:hypothetical protein MKX78_04720 [Cytobacillus sp. FSL R5-0569]|uniref:hypothetical protein n=1 Tax=Cytobacillus sp. FSL R5-0569 TaxID=2921649 RepID=UPI0030FB2C60
MKMAVVGPVPLGQEICHIASEFEGIDVIPLFYESAEQSPRLIENYKFPVDMYIFAGPSPFQLALKFIPNSSMAYYIPFEGADIYRLLLQVYEQYNRFPVISYDIVDQDYLIEVYEENNLTLIPYFLHSHKDGFLDSNALVRYHLKLLKNQQVEVIATTMNAVYEQLKSQDVPVFLIKHTKSTNRDMLVKAILKEQDIKKKELQLTVLRFEIKAIGVHDKQAVKEMITEIIIFGQNYLLSTSNVENMVVSLFSTRGVFEKVSKERTDFTFIEAMNRKKQLLVHLGIGIGDTAESANFNAQKALEHASSNERGSCYLIDEDKRIYGPLGTKESVSYPLLFSNRKNITLTLRRLYAWLFLVRKTKVTTRDISMGMNTSERHASRILKSLCDQEVAEITGKESMNQKGRPRHIYFIHLDKLKEAAN